MSDPDVIDTVGSTRTLNRLEAGEGTQLTFPVIGSLCDLYEVPAEEKYELQRLWRLGPATTWAQPRDRSIFGFDAYKELELHAKVVRKYESTFVPGPLQTENHMRMLFSSNTDLSGNDIEQAITTRRSKQRSFWEGNDQEFDFLLSEAVLRFGCDAEQIDRMFEANELEHATVRYLPFASGPPPLLLLPFGLLSFPDENDPDIVYVDAQDGVLYFEEAKSVRHYRRGLEMADDQAKSIEEFRL